MTTDNPTEEFLRRPSKEVIKSFHSGSHVQPYSKYIRLDYFTGQEEAQLKSLEQVALQREEKYNLGVRNEEISRLKAIVGGFKTFPWSESGIPLEQAIGYSGILLVTKTPWEISCSLWEGTLMLYYKIEGEKQEHLSNQQIGVFGKEDFSVFTPTKELLDKKIKRERTSRDDFYFFCPSALKDVPQKVMGELYKKATEYFNQYFDTFQFSFFRGYMKSVSEEAIRLGICFDYDNYIDFKLPEFTYNQTTEKQSERVGETPVIWQYAFLNLNQVKRIKELKQSRVTCNGGD